MIMQKYYGNSTTQHILPPSHCASLTRCISLSVFLFSEPIVCRWTFGTEGASVKFPALIMGLQLIYWKSNMHNKEKK